MPIQERDNGAKVVILGFGDVQIASGTIVAQKTTNDKPTSDPEVMAKFLAFSSTENAEFQIDECESMIVFHDLDSLSKIIAHLSQIKQEMITRMILPRNNDPESN